jgi:hypothetical protein
VGGRSYQLYLSLQSKHFHIRFVQQTIKIFFSSKGLCVKVPFTDFQRSKFSVAPFVLVSPMVLAPIKTPWFVGGC